MWASPGRNNNNSSSPSKSSSSSTGSSHAHCSPPSAVNPSLLAKESMEEVWKDITLTSVDDESASTDISKTANNPTFPSVILQDFLARPLDKDAPRRSGTSNVTSLAEETTFLSSLAPTPGAILSLNSGSDFQYIESGDFVRPPNRAVNSPTGGSEIFPSFCKKRAQENNENSGDRRYKRMMKNRESATRSRARKQAYTNELELEVDRLLEENAKLKGQQEKFLASQTQLPKKNTLSRTLTAPF